MIRYPIFAKDPSLERARRGEKEREWEKRESENGDWRVPGVCTRLSHYQQPTTNNQQPLLSSHYGSHSTDAVLVTVSDVDSFHPTMVLTQQDELLRGQKVVETFPSHYGSHSTGWIAARAEGCRNVSIPLWFSLRRAVHRQSSQSMDPSFERARRGEKEREWEKRESENGDWPAPEVCPRFSQ